MKYKQYWERLKTDHTLSVMVPKEYQKRVIKAIKMEKWKDTAYKAQQKKLNNGCLVKLAYLIEGNKITFYFRYPKDSLINL